MVLTCLLKGKFWGFVFFGFFFFWIMHWHELLLEFWSLSIVSPHNNPWDLVCMFLNSMLMHRISQKVLASEMQKAALGFSSQVPMMAVVSLFFSFVEVIFLFPFIECACLPSEMNVHCVHESPGEAKHFSAILISSWLPGKDTEAFVFIWMKLIHEKSDSWPLPFLCSLGLNYFTKTSLGWVRVKADNIISFWLPSW